MAVCVKTSETKLKMEALQGYVVYVVAGERDDSRSTDKKHLWWYPARARRDINQAFLVLTICS